MEGYVLMHLDWRIRGKPMNLLQMEISRSVGNILSIRLVD